MYTHYSEVWSHALATANAPAAIRSRFAWLLAFDARLSAIVARAREPLLAQMRLQWWHDVIAKPAELRPTGEPMVQALCEIDGNDALCAVALRLVAAWQQQMAGKDIAALRSEAIFGGYAAWVECSAPERQIALALGEHWAGSAKPKQLAGLPKKLRPLSLLTLAAAIDGATDSFGPIARVIKIAELFWHGLTGR